MLEAMGSSRAALAAVAVFGLVLALWCGAGLLWLMRRERRKRMIERRIGLYQPEPGQNQTRVLRLWRDGEEISTVVPHTSRLAKGIARLAQMPRDAGWDISIGLICAALSSAMLFVFGLGLVFTGGSLIAAVALALTVAIAFWYYMQHHIQRRLARFEQQFEDALQLIARSLKAGQPLLGAFQLVADEMDEPVSAIFGDICQRQALGTSLDESIRRVAAASGSDDLKLFATSVVIQIKTGGNLADMMQRLAHIIKERMRLGRRVRVLTAQTQYSKRVLLVLPVVVFVMLCVMNPAYMEPMIATSFGRGLSGAAVVSMILGTWMMNRMASLKY